MKRVIISNYSWALTEERTEIKYVYLNGTLNETVFYPREDWVKVVNSSGSFDFFYYIQNGKIIGMQDFNGKKFVILNDHKGSAYAVLDSNGNVLELTFYDPYGGIISGGQYTRFDYEGEEQDPTTGDSDFDGRHFDHDVPVSVEADPVIQNVYDPQTLNHYAFEKNSPYMNEDETGHCATGEPFTTAIAVSFCTAAAFEIAIQGIFAGDIYSGEKILEEGLNAATTTAMVEAIIASGGLAEEVWPVMGIKIAEGVSDILNYKTSIDEARTHRGFSAMYAELANLRLQEYLQGSSASSYQITNEKTSNSIGTGFSYNQLVQLLINGNSITTGGSSYKVETSDNGAELVKVTPIKSKEEQKNT